MSGSRYEVSVWGVPRVADRTDSIKQAVESASKLSVGGGALVVVTDTIQGRVRAFGYDGVGYWAAPCDRCGGLRCSRCLQYGFLKLRQVDWSN